MAKLQIEIAEHLQQAACSMLHKSSISREIVLLSGEIPSVFLCDIESSYTKCLK